VTTTIDHPPQVVPADPGPDINAGAPTKRSRSVLKRTGIAVASFVPVLFVSTFVTYALGPLSNNDPAATILGQDSASPAAVHKLNHTLGLDKPLLVQYWDWLTKAIRGDLGTSYFTHIPVWQSIRQTLPVDMSLAMVAAVVGVTLGGLAGTIAAVRRGGFFDRAVTFICSVIATLPAYVIGIILVVVFAMKIKWLPSLSYVGPTTSIPQWLRHIILPGLALSFQLAADMARQLRTSMVEVLDQNYIIGATVRGLPRRRILTRHALRNAAGPALVILGYDIPQVISGAVALEIVFSLPGMGQLAIQAASTRDIPVVQGVLLVVATFVIVSNLLINAALVWLRPGEAR
jgi:peptide/nickel transport system permease protein